MSTEFACHRAAHSGRRSGDDDHFISLFFHIHDFQISQLRGNLNI
jgi:hypothetical protein